jgi:hypothetical protein
VVVAAYAIQKSCIGVCGVLIRSKLFSMALSLLKPEFAFLKLNKICRLLMMVTKIVLPLREISYLDLHTPRTSIW